jgi:hypothetical protein
MSFSPKNERIGSAACVFGEVRTSENARGLLAPAPGVLKGFDLGVGGLARGALEQDVVIGLAVERRIDRSGRRSRWRSRGAARRDCRRSKVRSPSAPHLVSLSAPGGGEGRVRWGKPQRSPSGAHLTLPVTSRRVPSLSPLKGGEGILPRSGVQFSSDDLRRFSEIVRLVVIAEAHRATARGSRGLGCPCRTCVVGSRSDPALLPLRPRGRRGQGAERQGEVRRAQRLPSGAH